MVENEGLAPIRLELKARYLTAAGRFDEGSRLAMVVSVAFASKREDRFGGCLTDKVKESFEPSVAHIAKGACGGDWPLFVA